MCPNHPKDCPELLGGRVFRVHGSLYH